jgi:hypothetical protein
MLKSFLCVSKKSISLESNKEFKKVQHKKSSKRMTKLNKYYVIRLITATVFSDIKK